MAGGGTQGHVCPQTSARSHDVAGAPPCGTATGAGELLPVGRGRSNSWELHGDAAAFWEGRLRVRRWECGLELCL